MRRWKVMRVIIAIAMVAVNFLCATLAWYWPWFGYVGVLATVLLFLFLRSPPESEEKFMHMLTNLGPTGQDMVQVLDRRAAQIG
jgi:hypothetical protein